MDVNTLKKLQRNPQTFTRQKTAGSEALNGF